jgi:uncharacterized membrane protein
MAQAPQEKLEDEGPLKESGQGGAFAQLRGVASEAAVTALAPVAKKLATNAAKLAIQRGPELIEEFAPKLQEGFSQRFGGGDDDDDEDGGGHAGDGTGKGRRMPIQQSVDVAAPLEVVYDQWTQFEDYPKFMHRAERVEQRDDTHVMFHEKVWGVRRSWEAEILEQRPDERIVWRTTSGMQHVGVVTFHELSDRLTRIELNLDVDPDGAVEKIARGARFIKRAARADLKRFKAFVEMRDEETGEWRGEIEDAEVVDQHDEPDEQDDEEEEQEEPKNTKRARSNGKSSSSGSRSQSQSRSRSSSRSGSGSRKSSGSGSGSGSRKSSGSGSSSGSRKKATSGSGRKRS